MLRPLHQRGTQHRIATVYHRIDINRMSKYDTLYFRVREQNNKYLDTVRYGLPHDRITFQLCLRVSTPREHVAGANLHLTTTPPLAKFRPRN